MTELFAASAQWAKRPADEKFQDLDSMSAHLRAVRQSSATKVVASRALRVAPLGEDLHRIARKLGDDVKAFMATRFGNAAAERAMAVHQDEEGRPVESPCIRTRG